MISPETGDAGQPLETVWTAGTPASVSDAELLSRFVEARGRDATAETALRELVNRHAPLVWRVCRQILRREHDADDAFQATFLVLLRKARSIRVEGSLAPWLCGVAYRTAQRARVVAARYRPANVDQMEQRSRDSYVEADPFDLRPLLHEELNRLPGKFRDPIVLCLLEGKSREEAARLLRWPLGTVSSRLSRGRRLLRSRLERRGVAVAPAMLAARWRSGSQPTLPPPLLEATVAGALAHTLAHSFSTSVLSLTQGVLKNMWLRKLRTVSLFLLIGASMGGIGVWAHWPSSASKRVAHPSNPAVLAALEKDIARDRDLRSISQPAQPPASDQVDEADSRGTDCPAAALVGDLPADCPLSMAANAFAKIMGHFHSSSEPAR
jgi:RNA polymerase sigma factor (sigma-70 family)